MAYTVLKMADGGTMQIADDLLRVQASLARGHSVILRTKTDTDVLVNPMHVVSAYEAEDINEGA